MDLRTQVWETWAKVLSNTGRWYHSESEEALLSRVCFLKAREIIMN